MRSMALVILFILTLMTPQISFAQSPAFIKDMDFVLAVYDTANNLESLLDVTHQAERLTVRYNEEWLSHYWAAFMMTQINVYARDDRAEGYIRLAQFYFDQARNLWEKKDHKPEEEEADLYVLEGFIHSHKARISGYNNRDEMTLDGYYLDKALKTNPEHPIVWTQLGLSRLRDEKTRDEGIQNIKTALKYYKQPRISKVHPYWSIHFIPFWLKNYAPDVLQEVSIQYEQGGDDLGILRGHKTAK